MRIGHEKAKRLRPTQLSLRGIVVSMLIVATLFSAPLWVSAMADAYVASRYGPQIPFDENTWRSSNLNGSNVTVRQRMIRDLVVNVLPGLNRNAIEQKLGKSPAHAEMRRYTDADLEVREMDETGQWKPFPRTGIGHYWDEFDWDLLYQLGKEQIIIYDHKGQELSPDGEVLLIRLD